MAAAPVHSAQSPLQASQVFVDVLGNVPEGHVSRHWFDVKYLSPEHVRQLDEVEPLHVKHSE